MRNTFLLFVCLGSFVLTRAQTQNPPAIESRITISVSNNSLSISIQGKEVTVNSNQALDSCLQKIIPGLNHPSILLDAPNDIDRERFRTIGVILEKFHCPVMSFLKANPAKPAVSRSIDTVGH